MNQQIAVSDWNRRFGVGLPVVIERPSVFRGKTITPAQMRDGKAVIYADSMSGPVPLEWVRPDTEVEDLWRIMQAELAAQGFKPGEADEIDAEDIAGSTCGGCGGAREYHAYRLPVDDGEYRAFAVCPGCGDVEEF
jgi:hypothetical protein